MTCNCSTKRKSGSFNSWQDYQQFELSLRNGREFKEISVGSLYADVGLVETWFECMKCYKKWRLVEPDPPFKGIWEEVKNP